MLIIIIPAVFFDIANGGHDCASAITTVYRMTAVVLISAMNPWSVTLAKTVGTGILDPFAATDPVIVSAILSVILW